MLESNDTRTEGKRWRSAGDHKDNRDQSEREDGGDKQGWDKLMKPTLAELMDRVRPQ